jgi:hypothetical protein
MIGCGLLLAWGGVLNGLGFAYGWALDLLLGIGAAGSALPFMRWRRQHAQRSIEQGWALLLPGILAANIIVFVLLTQALPAVFNHHDDLQKYFAHPVRMLATGTLAGSSLSAVGLESLGGQAFLHALFLAHFPIQAINSADAVIGLLLLLLLLLDVGHRAPGLPAAAGLCMLLATLVNPQYVNVSSLYLMAAFIAATLLLGVSSPWVLGLFYASMLSLKTSALLFVAVHVLAKLVTDRMSSGGWQGGFRQTGKALGIAALFLAPWLLLHLANLLSLGGGGPSVTAPPVAAGVMWSTTPMVYGDTPLHYASLCLLCLIAGGLVWFAPTRRDPGRIAAAGFSVVPALVYVGSFVALADQLPAPDAFVRYFTPVAIGAVTAVALSRVAVP